MPLLIRQPLSIGAKATLIFSLFMCLLSFCITTFIWASIYKNTDQHLNEDINKSEYVIRQTLSFSQEKFHNAAQVLSNDFGFKHAVSTKDKDTLKSALDNHKNRINATLIKVYDLNGTLIASSSDSMNNMSIGLDIINEVQEKEGISKIIEIDNKIYQSTLVIINTPQPSAIALISKEINHAFIEDIKKITQLDISLEFKKDQDLITISTLSQDDYQEIRSNIYSSHTKNSIFGNERFYTKAFTLQSDSPQLRVYLTQDVQEDMNYLNTLKTKIILITSVVLLIAIFSVAYLTRLITSPLTKLSTTAELIAQDENINMNEIKIHSSTQEITALVISFNNMLKTINHREKKIRYHAENDVSTGIKNRASFLKLITYFYDNNLSVKVLALKTADIAIISDTFGYAVGDKYIKSIVDRIKNISSVCARLSTSQMVFTLRQDCTESDLNKLQRDITQTLLIDQIKISPHIFFTVLDLPTDCPSPQDILKKINIGLNAASTKSSKFARYTADIEQKHTQKLTVLKQLRSALTDSQHEFNMVYQPKINSSANNVHAEALLRWNNEQLGFVPPDLFIPLAEKAGLICDITYIVIEHVIKDVAIWKKQNITQKVAINLSVHDIDNIYLLPWIITKLEEYHLPTAALSFEIIESELMKDPINAAKQLDMYRKAGFNLAIDDFGTGYSSLAYLKNMPITELKIDKSFVLKLANEIDDQHIVQTIIYLAKSLNLETVAEGVEDAESLEMLKRFGCDWIQGYFISRPLNFDDYSQWYIDTCIETEIKNTV